MKSILKSIVEPIWNGLMVDLGSTLESIWGPFGVHFGVHPGSISRFGRDSSLRPPRDQISRPLWTNLDASPGPHVGPMLAVVGRIGASWSVLGAI